MLNHITIMGRLTRDPEIRYTQANVPVASFTLAVDRDYGKDENGNRQTDFIDCSAWRQTAEFVGKYFAKGSMAVVSGSLQSRHWEDKDHNKRTSWEVNVSNIYFGESKKDGAPAASPNPPQGNPPVQEGAWHELGDGDGELPF